MMAAERAKHKKKWIYFITHVSTSGAVCVCVFWGGAQNKNKVNLLKAEKEQFAWLRAKSYFFRLLLSFGGGRQRVILF